ncbi:UvrD-helicase domain-containing protein [Ileibacterium valens]|uniref:UvrD-helicase domain-containing protein n=1 Tax=Ileibacterium valens TaxID=1862668 RepID=UPI00272C40DC|nr:UvrD-helicase domain-containing protein [Ileibacterium valens]
MPVQLSKVQKRIVDERGKNILVSASAGSGKTTVLVERLIKQVIIDRIPVSDILAMTFTEDAAREMIIRLKQRLQIEDVNDPYIQNQLSLLETASISTIHGFCLNILQQFYYRLNLPYSMIQKVDNDILAQQARTRAYDRLLKNVNPSSYAALKIYMESCKKNENDLQLLILHLLEIAQSKPDPDAWLSMCRLGMEDEKVEKSFLDYFRLRILALREIFEQMRENVENLSFPKAQSKDEWSFLFEEKVRCMNQCLKDIDDLDYSKFRRDFLDYISGTGKFTPTIAKQSFKNLCDDYKALQADVAEHLFLEEDYQQAQQQIRPLQSTLVEMARTLKDYYQEEKRKMGFIDFSDMEQFAYQILSMEDIANEIREQYQVILVDEYQDTNDLQEAIISSIARKNNVFRVGDLKQSIYGFRQARPELMKGFMDHPDANSEVIYMDENYRSKDALIEFSNLFFKTLMNAPGCKPQFSDEDAAKTGSESQKSGVQKPVRFLFSQYAKSDSDDEESEEGTKSKGPNLVEARSLHKKNRFDWIAKDIQKKIEEGYSYRDIAILSRTSSNHQEIRDVLETWSIPSISRLKSGFYTNQAIQIILSALRILKNPNDDIALMAVLCSPIGKQRQSTVVKASLNRDESQSLYNALRFHPMMKFYDEMSTWKKLSLSAILRKLYAWNDFYYNFTTEQDKTNLDLLLEKASKAQSSMDLDEFLEQSSLESDFSKTGEAIPFGREDDVVKISTIHSSKGLQYKIVYLLSDDRDSDLGSNDPILIDSDLGLSFHSLNENCHALSPTKSRLAFQTRRFLEDQQEKMRLLYVAATRAEEELIFVDSIKALEDYEEPLSIRTLLNKKGFSGWLLNTAYENRNNPKFKLEYDEVDQIVQRPVAKSKKYFRKELAVYNKPVKAITSSTASGAKANRTWNPISFTSSANMERGTLFHELAARLSYPYLKEEFLGEAKKAGFNLDENDARQFLQLNHSAEFKKWMNGKHQFELPYSVNENGAYVHGFMDFVAFDQDTIHIVDFKTDSAFDMESLGRKYINQLSTYEQAMAQIYPDKKVRTYIYSFHLGELGELQPQKNLPSQTKEDSKKSAPSKRKA